MKLYAKTTSERATKGQGGNRHLNIEIFIDDREKSRFVLYINKNPDNSTTLALQDKEKTFPNNMVWGTDLKPRKDNIDCGCEKGVFVCGEHIKGNKQESEFTCKNKDTNGNACWDCEMGGSENDCGQTKGNKQKGKYLICSWCGKNPPYSAISEYCSSTCRHEATGKR